MATLTTITGGGAFTAQNIRNINSNFSALNTGGSGSSILHQATVTLNNDAIKALPSGGVTIVASPGANLVILPTSIVYVVDTLAGAYTNISLPADGAYLYVSWEALDIDVGIQNTTANSPFMGDVVQMDNLLGGTAQQVILSQVPPAQYAGGSVWIPFTAPVGSAIEKALTLDCFNDAGDFDDGHADNTFTVSVAYLILNTSTGAFE